MLADGSNFHVKRVEKNTIKEHAWGKALYYTRPSIHAAATATELDDCVSRFAENINPSIMQFFWKVGYTTNTSCVLDSRIQSTYTLITVFVLLAIPTKVGDYASNVYPPTMYVNFTLKNPQPPRFYDYADIYTLRLKRNCSIRQLINCLSMSYVAPMSIESCKYPP